MPTSKESIEQMLSGLTSVYSKRDLVAQAVFEANYDCVFGNAMKHQLYGNPNMTFDALLTGIKQGIFAPDTLLPFYRIADRALEVVALDTLERGDDSKAYVGETKNDDAPSTGMRKIRRRRKPRSSSD